MSFRLTRLIQLGAAYAGIPSDLRAQLRDPAGATVGSAISTGFVELGTASPTDPGAYIFDYSSYPDGFRGTVDIYKSSDSQWLAGFSVNPEEVTIAGSALSAADREAVADAILNRNVAGGSNAGRLVKEALYALRNKRAESAGVMTVYGTDDSTPAWTATVGREPKNPATSVDPA